MKIQGLGISSAGTSGTTTTSGGGAPKLWTPGSIEPHPMTLVLFGKRRPKKVDKRKYPGLKKSMRKLDGLKDQIAELAGWQGNDLNVELCEGSNAFISPDGEISFGVGLLEQHQQDDDLLVAVMSHEIGHQPWTWKPVDISRLSKAQRDQICRDEEAKADRFAGKVMADLGADPDAVCKFLLRSAKFETHPPTDYYPAEQRSTMIREAFQRRNRVLSQKRAALGQRGPPIRELR